MIGFRVFLQSLYIGLDVHVVVVLPQLLDLVHQLGYIDLDGVPMFVLLSFHLDQVEDLLLDFVGFLWLILDHYGNFLK